MVAQVSDYTMIYPIAKYDKNSNKLTILIIDTEYHEPVFTIDDGEPELFYLLTCILLNQYDNGYEDGYFQGLEDGYEDNDNEIWSDVIDL